MRQFELTELLLASQGGRKLPPSLMTRSGAGVPYKLDLLGSFTSENTVSRFFFFSQRDWVCRKIVDAPRVLLILGPGAKSALCRISGINSRQRGINFFFFSSYFVFA